MNSSGGLSAALHAERLAKLGTAAALGQDRGPDPVARALTEPLTQDRGAVHPRARETKERNAGPACEAAAQRGGQRDCRLYGFMLLPIVANARSTSRGKKRDSSRNPHRGASFRQPQLCASEAQKDR